MLREVLILGIFTVPVSGAWRVKYRLTSEVDSSEQNWATIYINNGGVIEATHHALGKNGRVRSNVHGGFTLQFREGDSITLRATYVTGVFWGASFCVDFTTKS